MSNHIVSIHDIVDGGLWVDPTDGMRVYEQISKIASNNDRVQVDFSRKDVVITAFLNSAIGSLYNGALNEDQISLVSYINTTPDDDDLITRVCDNAKTYYANKKAIDEAWSDEFDEE